MKKILITLILLVLFISPSYADGQFVQRVVDGQTLKLLNGEIVKLIGFNVSSEQAEEAGKYVRSLVSGSVVALEYDVEQTDNEGNILAYVWFKYEPRMRGEEIVFPDNFDVHYVVDESGEGDFFVLLNTTIVKAGLGNPSDSLPNGKYSKLITKLFEERPIKTAKAEIELQAMVLE